MPDRQATFFLLQVPGKSSDSKHTLADEAHAFHSNLASTNPNLKPRYRNAMREFADRGELFGVRRGKSGEWVGVGYAVMRDDESEYEIGGLAVDARVRSCGIGELLAHIVIAYVITYDNPLPCPIVAYVRIGSTDPRPLLKSLGFESVGQVSVSTTEGTSYRDKFQLRRSAIRKLADWLDKFNGLLRDKESTIETDLDLDVMRRVLQAEGAKGDKD